MSRLLFPDHFSHFAPSERLAKDLVLQQSQVVAKLDEVRFVFDQLPSVILIINQQRQIVYCNQALLDLLNIEDSKQILGARPGEVLSCVHARENSAGCGTTEACRTCGGALAILASIAGEKASRECRITVQKQQEFVCLDLRFTTTPFTLEGQQFTTVFVTDISDEKRRKALERIFFHDILNTAGSLRGIVELLGTSKEPTQTQELLQDLEEVAGSLIEEILEQRDLISAENNELRVQEDFIRSVDILQKVVDQLSKHPTAQGIGLQLDDQLDNVLFETDPLLLKRVLGNMVKNALEASQPGDVVRLGVRKEEQVLVFWVHNSVAMPKDVQLQVFQRSFSTKGSGRGLGTYSMKLLTERYLKGTVSFTVSDEGGTTFYAELPRYLGE